MLERYFTYYFSPQCKNVHILNFFQKKIKINWKLLKVDGNCVLVILVNFEGQTSFIKGEKVDLQNLDKFIDFEKIRKVKKKKFFLLFFLNILFFYFQKKSCMASLMKRFTWIQTIGERFIIKLLWKRKFTSLKPEKIDTRGGKKTYLSSYFLNTKQQ